MNERVITQSYYLSGTLAANHTILHQFPHPVTFVWAEAGASNDSSATLALSGASTLSIAAQAIGDSGAMTKIVPASTDVDGEIADSLITVTLDYDGASGTAAENVNITIAYLLGDD